MSENLGTAPFHPILFYAPRIALGLLAPLGAVFLALIVALLGSGILTW